MIVSERTRRLAGGEFVYQDLGAKELGVSGLPRVYRVVGVSEAESRFEAATQRGLTTMVGRREEIGALLARGAGSGKPAPAASSSFRAKRNSARAEFVNAVRMLLF